jgi:hypothetical protein
MELIKTIAIWWVGAGLLGSVVFVFKSAEKSKGTFFALFALIHAVIFGPLFLMIALAQDSRKLCPFCKSAVRRDAAVCSKCTREF